MEFAQDSDFVVFLLTLIVVGGTVGWLMSHAVGSGIGSIGDIVIGVFGAFLAAWAFPRVGVHISSGLLGTVVTALIGSFVVLIIFRLVGQR